MIAFTGLKIPPPTIITLNICTPLPECEKQSVSLSGHVYYVITGGQWANREGGFGSRETPLPLMYIMNPIMPI